MKYLIQGNFHTFNVTLTQNDGTTTTPYIPTENDKILINLNTANKQFQYKDFSQSQNVLTFTDNGCLSVGVYQLEVKIIDRASHKLRCMYRDQLMVVASNDDIPLAESFDIDDVNLGAEITINPQIVVDDELSLTSENPVQNKVVTSALNRKVGYMQSYADAETGFNDGVIRIFGYNNDEDFTDVTSCILGCVGDGGVDSEFISIGLMRIEDKTKLDALPTNSVLQTALNSKADTLESANTFLGVQFNLKRGDAVLASAPLLFAGLSQGKGGLMSGYDYTKLSALPTNADLTTALASKQDILTFDITPTQGSNNPVTSDGLFGVIKRKADSISVAPYNLGVELLLKSGDDVIYSYAISNATTDTGGIMSASDKTKLDGIEAGANKTIVDSALNGLSSNPVENRVLTSKLDTVTQKLATKYDNFYKDFYPDAIDFYFMADGEYVANWYIESANSTNAGLMSATDKTKLDGITQGATRVIVDNALNTSSNNAISNSAVATALGDIETILDNILGN